MSAVEQIERAAIQDAVDAVWTYALKTGTELPEAVRELWPTFDFDAESLELIGCRGLIQIAHLEKQHALPHPTRGNPHGHALPWGAPHGKKWEVYVALTWPYKAADGSQKILLNFTDADLAAFASRCRTLAVSWTSRADWASRTEQVLRDNSVGKIKDLPPLILKQVERDALVALGGEEA